MMNLKGLATGVGSLLLVVSRNSDRISPRQVQRLGHKAMARFPIAKAIGHSDVVTTLRYYVDSLPRQRRGVSGRFGRGGRDAGGKIKGGREMSRIFKSSVWMFLLVFVFMVKGNAQAEPQSEKKVINLGSANSSYKIEETNFQDKSVLEDYFGKPFYISYYFPLHQGDTWEYRVFSDNGEQNQGRVKIDGTEIVNGVETKKRYEFLYDYQDESYYESVAQNSEGFVWYKRLSAKDAPPGKFWNPPLVYFPLRMRIGQSFTSYWLDARLADAPNATISGRTIELEGLETVTVPAGTFKGCLKIKYGQFDHEEDPSDHEVTKGWIWLARGVGIVKSVEYGAEYLPHEQKTDTWTDTIELTKYKINNAIK